MSGTEEVIRYLSSKPPSERQALFLSDNEHKYIGYGGARGGGKSWAVRVKAVLLCLKYPGIKVMIVRRTYPELYENHIRPLSEMLGIGTENPIAKYNDGKKHITFYNGSRIIFRYCETEKDTTRFQGTEVDVLFVDEATHQTEGNMDALKACVRGVNDYPKRIYYTMNPGSVGHGWVKRLFIDRNFREGERAEEYTFIPAKVTDNEALMQSDPDYIRRLEALPPKLRAAWLDGKWDVFNGQFFDDFLTEPDMEAAEEHGCQLSADELKAQGRWCHVIDPIDLNEGERRGWRIYRSYDWGYNKPFSCAWWAIDYDGTLYRIMELYGCTETANEGVRLSDEQVFEKIAKTERTHPWLKGKQIEGVADPSIWASHGGPSTAETAEKYGIYFSPGDNERIPGWMQCHYRLQFDDEGRPRMYIFSNCRAFIRTVPLLLYDTTQMEDLDTKLEDHVADEWRYMCMARPVQPLKATKQESFIIDPLNQLKQNRR